MQQDKPPGNIGLYHSKFLRFGSPLATGDSSAFCYISTSKKQKNIKVPLFTESMPTGAGATGQTRWRSAPPANLCQLLYQLANGNHATTDYFELMTSQAISIIFQYGPVMELVHIFIVAQIRNS